MALTKAEMAEHLFETLGINKRVAKEMVEAFFEEIRQALESGEQVKLSGFGNFDLRDKNQDREGTRKQAKIFQSLLAEL
jgi:integration host factor subunit alpha